MPDSRDDNQPATVILDWVELGLFRDACSSIDKLADCPRSLMVVRAQLEAHVGSPTQARLRAERLMRDALGNCDEAVCLDVIGRVQLGFGETECGVQTIRRAVRLAADCGNLRLEARLTASLTEALLRGVGIESATAEIPKLRRAAFRAGDGHSLIALHSLIAEIHAKRRLLGKASHHLATARRLVQQFENVWLRGKLAVTSAGVAMIGSDYQAALVYTQEAVECAQKSGSAGLLIPALGNLAHIRLAHASIAEAQTALSGMLNLVRKGGTTEIGVRDTQMQVALACHDEDLAAALAQEISELSKNLDDGYSYYGLWHLLTRVKWLYRSGQVAAGVALALDALPRIERMADRNLLERMKLLSAEGFGRTGRPAAGAALMAEAVNANPDPPLEIIAEASRVAGRLAAHDDRPAALTHFMRAARIFTGVGNLTARAEVARDAAESAGATLAFADTSRTGPLPDATGDPGAIRQPPEPDLRPPAAPLAERIAALLDLSGHPPLLATEALSLLADTGAIRHAAVIEAHPDGARRILAVFQGQGFVPLSPPAGAVTVSAGTHRDREYQLIAVPRDSPTARSTVLAVERIVQGAAGLAQARQREREQADLWPEPSAEQQLGLVSAAESMVSLIKTTRRIAATNLTVLITGETGVGKDLFARALHQASPRHDKPFISFNCATVPREMIDSQLFGFRRGAFTGAHEDFAGVLRAATGGTLFLDEIGEMSIDVQPKLLRFLESGELLPLGDTRSQLVDVRVVTATNANLEHLVEAGRFREDLYYRLNVIRLMVPPLRERREEVPMLVGHFLEACTRDMQKPLIRIADDTLEYLVLYRWPGNVRQLANEVRRMVALAEAGAVLMPEHLSAEILASRRSLPPSERTLDPTEMVVRTDQPLGAAVDHVERALILRALGRSGGNLEQAAKTLGVTRKGLYLKRQRLGLQ